MTETIDLDKILKDVASLTIDSMLIPPKKFDSKYKAAIYFQRNLDTILDEFYECFRTDVQAHLAKHIADA